MGAQVADTGAGVRKHPLFFLGRKFDDGGHKHSDDGAPLTDRGRVSPGSNGNGDTASVQIARYVDSNGLRVLGGTPLEQMPEDAAVSSRRSSTGDSRCAP